VIAAAPWTVAAILLAFAAVSTAAIWRALSWSYQSRLHSRDDQIALLQRQRDEYKEKLSGASPEEAKAKIDDLERRLLRLEPRMITAEQREAIVRVLGSVAGEAHIVEVAHDAACADCNRYAAEVGAAIRAASGWSTVNSMVMAPSVQPAKGIAVLLPNLNNPGRTASLLMRALSDAGVAFEALRTPWGNDVAAATILVSARTA
jgi:hypothetical protein